MKPILNPFRIQLPAFALGGGVALPRFGSILPILAMLLARVFDRNTVNRQPAKPRLVEVQHNDREEVFEVSIKRARKDERPRKPSKRALPSRAGTRPPFRNLPGDSAL
ncbi:MAG TPA: hypothetical protein VH280_01795 [Verrucomicrobiae bacterium]|jgi:hypothetical protein|nr:hypothetical protein [Verrucomicrobiae bacterium]